MMSSTHKRITLGYTPITQEIKDMIMSLVSDDYTLSDVARDINFGYRARTQAMKKVLGETEKPYKTIRIDIVERLRLLVVKNNVVG